MKNVKRLFQFKRLCSKQIPKETQQKHGGTFHKLANITMKAYLVTYLLFYKSCSNINVRVTNRHNRFSFNNKCIDDVFNNGSLPSDSSHSAKYLKASPTIKLPSYNEAFLIALQNDQDHGVYTSFDDDSGKCVVDNCVNMHI